MDINELYTNFLESQIIDNLTGDLYLEDEIIKWEYDGIAQIGIDMETHLFDVFQSDEEIILDFISENDLDNNFYIHDPEVDETIITSFISEI